MRRDIPSRLPGPSLRHVAGPSGDREGRRSFVHSVSALLGGRRRWSSGQSSKRMRGFSVATAALLAWLGSFGAPSHSLLITVERINQAVLEAKHSLLWRHENAAHVTRKIGEYSFGSTSGCPFAVQRHLTSLGANKWSRQVATVAHLFEETTKILLSKMPPDVDRQQVLEEAQQISLQDPTLLEADRVCADLVYYTCDLHRAYRISDGSCNNHQNPSWGRAGSCMKRLLEPAYADGVSTPRISVTGSELPNARYISYAMHPDVNRPWFAFTHMVMQFGQFMDHDFALAPVEEDPGQIANLGNPNNPIDCCSPERRSAAECYSIDVPAGDPFYSHHGETCLNMARSAPCSCHLGYREQQDILTSYLDLSQVYGSSEDDTRRLRLGQGGLLQFQLVNNEELLPRSFHPERDRCSRPDSGDYCFRAGDERANEHPGLTAMHTIWLRQHNRVARTLQHNHADWDDQTLFHQARRIVESQYQHIVYTEWIPLVLGKGTLSNFDLQPGAEFTYYDPSVDASMLNEFAAAAFRMGHTLIDGRFTTVNAQGIQTSFHLQDFYFFPFYIYQKQTDDIMRGLASQSLQDFDRFITNGVTEHLYRLQNETFGLDLIALNIQRGRDHGLRSYVDYYHFCTGRSISTFDELRDANVMSPQHAQFYATIYRDVRDIDLFTGAVAETSVFGGLVGPTFACIMAHQFKKLKFGDRFYYEHANQAGSFTREQLYEIRKTTLARIICDNTYTVSSLQRNVFLPPNETTNPQVPCESHSVTDLTRW